MRAPTPEWDMQKGYAPHDTPTYPKRNENERAVLTTYFFHSSMFFQL